MYVLFSSHESSVFIAHEMIRCLQEKEAKEARLTLEFEAEQIEEHGEAVRSEFVKRPNASKATISVLSYVRVAKDAVASRREEEIMKVIFSTFR